MAFGTEVFEASVVNKYLYCIGDACQLRALFFKGLDNLQQLFVVNLVVVLSKLYFARHIGHQTYSVISLNLEQDCSVDVESSPRRPIARKGRLP